MDFFTHPGLAEAVLNIACQSASVLLLGWLLVQLLRRRSAPLRSGVSLIVMLVLLLVPFFSLGFSQWGYSGYAISLPILPFSSTQTSFSVSDPSFLIGGQAFGFNPSTPAADQKSTLQVGWIAKPHLIPFINLFGMLWGIGTLFLLLRLLYGVISIRKLRREMEPLPHLESEELRDQAARRFGRNIRLRVFESPHADGPVVIGFFRPVILFPKGLQNKLSKTEIRSILVHELSHIQHHDQISALIQRTVTALNWWNPLSFSLSRFFSRAREEVSDNYVLQEYSSHDYAECLINLAERSLKLRRLPVGYAMASPHIPLADRVRYILSKERTMETQLKKSRWLLIGLLGILLAGGLTGYRLSFAASDAEETLNPAPEINPLEMTHRPSQQETEIKQPKLIKKVDPTYPEEAKQQGLEGTVAVEALVDAQGRIAEAKVIHSAHELLDRASVEAVKKWTYQPMEIEGTPRRFFMTVIFRFSLENNQPRVSMISAETGGSEKKAPLRAVGDIKPPRLIKQVDPIYPHKAKEAGIEGVVILEAITDKYGRVEDVNILRSIPDLDQAAIDAVKQWVYEPMVVNGEPRGVTFTVTVRFSADDEKKSAGVGSGVSGGVTGGVAGVVKGGVATGVKGGVEGGVASGVGGGTRPPKLLKSVDPVYPKEAKEAGIEGVVILELKTDIRGRVQNVRVLRSIPALDQAAIDAVKQWVYEPPIIDGKPQELTITVTVRFEKDK